MKIELQEVTIRELTEGYKDNSEEGVTGFGGKLDIRPPYQREFIYKDKQRNAVIDSVKKNFPLNVMYWAVREDGNYEIIDGQQRTVSICQYVTGDFSLNDFYFHNLSRDKQKQILDYPLMIYFCSGSSDEKLDWFRTINIAGVEHTHQELRNASYVGSWTYDAKKHFSKTGCPAHRIASDYMKGSSIRQEYLERALDWISEGKIEDYMANHQRDPNANELWLYFQSVINWTKVTFVPYRKEMKGVDFGFLYRKFGGKPLDPKKLEEEIVKLMQDDDVTKKSGIYTYVLTRDEKYLNVRSFTKNQKREAYEGQKGICPKCDKYFEFEEMAGDHRTPWRDGGKTISENCQMLCKDCNRRKGVS